MMGKKEALAFHLCRFAFMRFIWNTAMLHNLWASSDYPNPVILTHLSNHQLAFSPIPSAICPFCSAAAWTVRCMEASAIAASFSGDPVESSGSLRVRKKM